MNDTTLTTTTRFDLSAIDHADLADSTKKKYKRAIQAYLDTGAELADYQTLTEYTNSLSRSGRAFLKAAIRLTAAEYERKLKASATPENVGAVQAGLYRLEALQDTNKVEKTNGTKVNTWLSQKQVRDITRSCADDLEGKRDWIILGLLLGAGLRREELVSLTFDALKQQPLKGGGIRWVLDVNGRGAKDRVVPIKPILAERLRAWQEFVGGGLVARSLGRKKELGESLSAVAVFHIVRKHGEQIGMPELTPHDCRRTYAQLGYDAGVPITQLSVLLGHADVGTTQRYLNLDLDLETTVSDFIPLVGD